MKTEFWFTVCGASLVLGLSLIREPARHDTAEQIKNAQEYERYHAPLGTPRCQGDIPVELLGGIRMVVTREAMFKNADRDTIKQDLRHPMYDCSVTRLSDLSNVYVNQIDIYAPGEMTPNYFESTVSELSKEGTSTTLPSGVRKIDLGGTALYILPLKTAPTADSQPVVFRCFGDEQHPFTTDSCSTYYVLPNHLGIHYLVPWSRSDATDYLRIDKEKRAFIANAITKAKQSTSPETIQ